VYSAGRYRPRFFLDQLKAGLANFENWNTESIDHSYLGSINSFKVAFIYLKYVISIKEVNVIVVAKCADYWQVARRLCVKKTRYRLVGRVAK